MMTIDDDDDDELYLRRRVNKTSKKNYLELKCNNRIIIKFSDRVNNYRILFLILILNFILEEAYYILQGCNIIVT